MRHPLPCSTAIYATGDGAIDKPYKSKSHGNYIRIEIVQLPIFGFDFLYHWLAERPYNYTLAPHEVKLPTKTKLSITVSRPEVIFRSMSTGSFGGTHQTSIGGG